MEHCVRNITFPGLPFLDRHFFSGQNPNQTDGVSYYYYYYYCYYYYYYYYYVYACFCMIKHC